MKPFKRMLLAFVIATLVGALAAAPALAKPFTCTLTPDFGSITVTWKKVPDAAVYKVYRADATKCAKQDAAFPAMKKYQKIATIKKASKCKYTDSSCKKNRYYCYVVKAYSKKGKLLASTYNDDWASYALPGFGRPDIFNNGYGENYLNSKKALHIAVQEDYAGVAAKGATWKIYRKTSTQKKFKLWKTFKSKVEFCEIADKSVKAGKTYQYRAKLVVKKHGKTYASPYSQTLTIPAVAFQATYKVKAVTPAATNEDGSPLEVVIKLVNASNDNGVTRVLPRTSTYFHAAGKSADADMEEISFTAYSTDNKTWKPIPDKGAKLPAKGKGALFLKGTLKDDEGAATVWLGNDSTAATSLISLEGDMLEYAGPGAGETYGGLDLLDGTGSAYQEWD